MSRVLPILFNTDMVRAILDGRKTVTRRLIKLPKYIKLQDDGLYTLFAEGECYENQRLEEIVAYLNATYQLGDTLYVRETWCLRYDGEKYFYKADKNTPREEKRLIDYDHVSWKPSIHMPKEAARIWLKVKDVRVERLHEITVEDVQHEGISALTDGIFERFKNLWNSTIKKADIDIYGWDANPWVWVIEFERCEKPNESPYAWNDAINKIVGGMRCD